MVPIGKQVWIDRFAARLRFCALIRPARDIAELAWNTDGLTNPERAADVWVDAGGEGTVDNEPV